MEDSRSCVAASLPKELRQLPAAEANRIKIRRGGVVAEGATGVDYALTALPTGMKTEAIGMVFQPSKRSADIVVGETDLEIWVSNAEVVKPNHKAQLCTRES